MNFKKLSYRHKNNKFKYYVINYLRQLIPSKYYQNQLSKKLNDVTLDYDIIEKRVNYYNKLDKKIELNNNAQKLSDVTINQGSKVYYFDLYEYSRFFNQSLKGHFLFGDITEVPQEPGFVKSRPIGNDNAYSIVLKWDKVRHFISIKNEKKEFLEKKNMLVSRASVYKSQQHRVRFLEMYFGHPMCNIGQVNTNYPDSKWIVNRMTFDEQLEYKFILSLEGNDVATNLKWIMSSKSIAVMPKPKFETWFMEGLLVPDFHYILIKDDYSDLESKLNYYINNPDKALSIIENANRYVEQFQDQKIEDITSLLVMKKYFEKTNQIG